MKSRATRNIQIEKQTRRVLRKAAGAWAHTDVKPATKKSARKAREASTEETTKAHKIILLRPGITNPDLWYPERPPDKEWQRIRQLVLERDDWTCAGCGHRAHKFMNVHHLKDSGDNERAEIAAKDNALGLWREPNPIPPWFFRRDGRAKQTVKALGTATATGDIIGNRNSKIYHRPDCPDYSKVSERNRVMFKNESEALTAGYRRAKNCP